MTQISFPALRPEFEPTRATLHAYAHAVGAIPRAHGIAHPKWWHISLTVRPEGLATDPIPLPDGGALSVTMDLRSHRIEMRTTGGGDRSLDMTAGMTATELGDALVDMAGDHGLTGPFDRARFDNDEARSYDPQAASAYFRAFTAAATAFERHRVDLGDRVGPIQVWPHGFDLAFEWFGTRTERYGEEELPAQINLGFTPGPEPYFYSNPWPFEDRLLDVPLPHGARWHTDGWQGAVLAYGRIEGDPAASTKLRQFAGAVFEAAAPSLGRT